MRVLVFGDSNTQGFWDIDGGWASRLRKHYDIRTIKRLHKNKDYPEFYNLGISGNKTVDVLQRFEDETKSRRWKNEEFIIIFAIGLNDTTIMGGSEISNTDVYREQLERLLSEANKYSDKILFVGLTPVEEKLTNPVPWDKTIHYTNDRIFLFENVMRDECLKHHVPHVAVMEEMQDRIIAGQKLLEDGLHPNSEGHELIFKLVLPQLEKLLAT
ncbi:MAG TPA: SGNH/GDSL hydrolase family protein [Candidatus Saccharimonadales bacterium]|nr:SGNH/GDSL hydrolase family protein [Candidatus Saccharimonadales bacterium]